MIADMEANNKLSFIVSKLLLRGRKLNILLVHRSKFWFKEPKAKRLNVILFYHQNT